MSTKYPKGAEWRKWDLHVHTPGTAKNDRYKSEGEGDVWEEFIRKLEHNSEISVIGITDYFSIENYLKVKEEQTNGRLQNKIIFPNIELRITPVTKKNKPINLHVIFDPQLDKDTLEREFFRALTFEYEDATYSCIRSDLIKLGRAYTRTELLLEDVAWREGIGQFNIPFSDLKNVFEKNIFSEKYLIGVTNNSNDGNSGIQHSALKATRQEIYRFSNFIFSSNPKDVKYFIGEGCDSIDKIISDYGSLKPCLTGSDAHSLNDVFNFQGDRNTWIKADPTFEGFKQVINEPKERIFIGDKPHLFNRVNTNRTKYIKELSIKKVANYNGSDGTWFDNVSIPFNQELVAIIGNKGSGKSAIADILSFCSNYDSDNDFSFLTKKKFREKSGKIAKNFEAILTWENEKSKKRNLNDTPEFTELLTVKYLPQGRFEQLTNEIGKVDNFQKEIESVVFSHILDSEKLGSRSFKELIEIKSSTVESEISSLKNDIGNINKQIIELEKKSTPSYKIKLENKIKKKKEELEALIEPQKVSDPNDDPEKKKQNEVINNKITAIKNDIEKIENKILDANSKKEKLLTDLHKLKTVKIEIEQKETEINRFKIDRTDELTDFKIDIDKLISIKTNFVEINALICTKESELNAIKLLLGEVEGKEDNKSLQNQLEEKQGSLKTETAKLDAEQKLYHDYLADESNWKKEKSKINGSDDRPDTLKFFQIEIEYLNNQLNKDLDSKYEERRKIVESIFDEKQKVISVYKNIRERLNKIIDNNSQALKEYKIVIDASLVKQANFFEIFLGYIDKGKMGSFYSKDGGEEEIKSLSSEINFDKKDEALSFLDSIIDALKKDKRPNQNESQRVIAEQVKNIPELYNYLFSLDFLENNYQLKQGNKTLEQLSPGERGALLLVFYLLLDKNDIPLIIDQPEDNLDNQSVATVLVPFIRAAKKNRQIIMVTHNPNLAVVADAEQVINVNLDKENNYAFLTVIGSIENREVNQKIVEVLEGTMPAFKIRKKKYYDNKK